MFKLWVPITEALKNCLSYPALDFALSLIKYSSLGVALGIEVVGTTPEQLLIAINNGEIINGIFSVWGSGILYGLKRPWWVTYKENGTKLILFWDDIHWWDQPSLENRLGNFRAADLLLLPYQRSFLKYKEFEEFHSKSRQLFWHAPDVCFDYKVNYEVRRPKIALTGSIGKFYPLRQKLLDYLLSEKHSGLERLKHSGYDKKEHNYWGRNYYTFLSQYRGAIATSAAETTENGFTHKLDYTLCKTFEVTGSGCLGFLEETEDFRSLGLIPYENFIPIDLQNYKENLKLVLDPSTSKIAEKGRELVRQNHSSKNRAIEIFQFIREAFITPS